MATMPTMNLVVIERQKLVNQIAVLIASTVKSYRNGLFQSHEPIEMAEWFVQEITSEKTNA